VQFGFLLSKISSDQCHEAFSTRDTIDLPNNQNNSTRKVQSLSSRESDQCGRPNTSMSALRQMSDVLLGAAGERTGPGPSCVGKVSDHPSMNILTELFNCF
jgi:hypothetical protein